MTRVEAVGVRESETIPVAERTNGGEIDERAFGRIVLGSQGVAGLLFFLLASGFMIVMMLGASMAPGYDMAGGAISDLGVFEETALLFNGGLILVGLTDALGAILFYRSHRRLGILAISLAAAAGAIGAGLVPLDRGGLHGLFALVAFLAFNLQAIATGTVLSGPMKWISYLAGALGLLFVVLMAVGDGGNEVVFGAIGHGGTERMIVYPVMLWMLALGGYLMAGRGPVDGPASRAARAGDGPSPSLLATLVLSVLLGGGALAGCVTTVSSVQARDTVALSLDVPQGTPVRVETFNGGIEVSPSAGAGISAEVVRTGRGVDQAAAEADRDAIEVTLEEQDGVAVLRAVYTPDPVSIPTGSGAAVTLFVPQDAGLELSTSNGPISVQDMVGGIDAQTSNGPIDLNGVAGTVMGSTSNGPVTVSTGEPVSVELRTSNGGITFDGALLPGGAVFDTSNGPVELRLPADSAFSIDARTSASSATTDFELDGTVDDGSMVGTVGAPVDAGGVFIEVRTSNGPIRLLEKEPGS